MNAKMMCVCVSSCTADLFLVTSEKVMLISKITVQFFYFR